LLEVRFQLCSEARQQGVNMQTKTMVFAAVLSVAPGLLHAQFDFKLAGRPVQVHSFGSQGFVTSSNNNYLTMDSKDGSFAFTDVGANISMPVTDKFRVGAQFYTRNVGNLGNWGPTLDWVMGDYKFKDWLGVRAGKVKTVLGLYNDTQDMEFLHTWALVPQATYPLDTRGDTIAHLGADIYGNIALKRLGSFSYTLYGGHRPSDPKGGYVYSLDAPQNGSSSNAAIPSNRSVDSYGGPVYGSDLRWTTPVKGVVAGVSLLKQDITTDGLYKAKRLTRSSTSASPIRTIRSPITFSTHSRIYISTESIAARSRSRREPRIRASGILPQPLT
jgi:hypothetical protein